jgi:hypothetical protein
MPQPFIRQAGNAPQIKPVAQLKIAVSAQSVKRPVAPAAYRPQSKSLIAQAKMAHASQMKNYPLAPQVYRPQSVPKVLQTKTTAAHQLNQSGRAGSAPDAPPVYRPQPAPGVLQTKIANGHQSQTGQAVRQPVAPAAYRPQPVPKLMQAKISEHSRSVPANPNQNNQRPARKQQTNARQTVTPPGNDRSTQAASRTLVAQRKITNAHPTAIQRHAANLEQRAGVIQRQATVIQRVREKFEFVPAADDTGMGATVANIFQAAKVASKQHSNNDAAALDANLLGGGNVPGHLWNFERDYLAHGRDWPAVRAQLEGEVDIELVNQGNGVFQINHVFAGGMFLGEVGKVYVGPTARFEPVNPQPGGLAHLVFQRQGRGGRHYVRDSQGHFIKRFVTRGLKYEDAIALDNNNGLTAPHPVAATPQANETNGPRKHNVGHPPLLPRDLTEQEQLLSHARGWQKRYISTTTTVRPAYSTRGTQFRSLFGAAIVDLARVNQGSIFDLHTPAAAQAHFGMPVSDITTAPAAQPVGQNLANERFLALRDVVRTREVLIKGTIPNAAMLCARVGTRVVGVGDQHAPHQNEVTPLMTAQAGYANDSEALSYLWNNGRWVFYLYNSDPTATAAEQALVDWLAVPNGCQLKQHMRIGIYQTVQPAQGW